MEILNFFKAGLALVVLSSCQSHMGQTKEIPLTDSLYINLENRESFPLPEVLDEISGHVFLPGNDSVVYCIQDEQGILYGYNLNSQLIQDTLVFAEKGDFEGLTTDGHRFYVLKSNGSIYSFPINGVTDLSEVKIIKGILGKGEYESLSIDTAHQKLVVLCKSCKEDNKNNSSTGYFLNYNESGEVSLDRSFALDLEKVTAIRGKALNVFNPSAITKRESSNEWLILSSIDKLLLVTDSSFNPKTVVSFSRKQYEQPEGIAYDNKGNLYISSEKGSNQSAMLYKIIQ